MNTLVVAVLALSTFPLIYSTPVVLKRDIISDDPPASRFLRRAFQASIVIDDYVFIDGGEMSQLVDGSPDPGFGYYYSRQENSTLSIPLASSWVNSSVPIRSVLKGQSPVLCSEVLWKGPDGKSFYAWGGEWSNVAIGLKPPPVGLWQFTSDGYGGGNWSQIDVSDPVFSTLLRPNFGFGTTIGDMAYYVGGYVGPKTDPSVKSSITPIPGVISFNMTSAAWSNESSIGLNSNGMTNTPAVVTIPAFGLDDRGLLFIFGGRDPSIPYMEAEMEWVMATFSNISIYDPYIGNWYAQHATGDIPGPRERFCAVAIQGDNGTSEIFVYGGLEINSFEGYDEVYVLTIPGFTWFKAPIASGAPRFQHSCEIVGNRQLLIIGGLDNRNMDPSWPQMWQVPDPASQGLEIFDMTDMVWRASYDASAPAYQSPRVVKDWYAEGNQASVKWQSKEIARMFIKDIPVVVEPTPVALSPSATGTSGVNSTKSQGGISNDGLIAICTSIISILVALVGIYIGWKQLKRPKGKRVWSRWPFFKDLDQKGKATREVASVSKTVEVLPEATNTLLRPNTPPSDETTPQSSTSESKAT